MRNWGKGSKMRFFVINSKLCLWESPVQFQERTGINPWESDMLMSAASAVFKADLINSCHGHHPHYLGLFCARHFVYIILNFQ